MPPKTTSSNDTKFLLAIIESLGGISGAKWDAVSEKMGGQKTANALRKQFNRIKEKVEKDAAGAGAEGDGAGDAKGGEVKPATKKKVPAKKRKVEQVEDAENEDAE